MNWTTNYQLLMRSWLVLLMLMFASPWLQAHESSLAQVKPLSEVLEDFSERYQVLFSYDSKSLAEVAVDFHFRPGESLEAAMSRLLEPTDFGYESFGEKYYVVYEKTRRGRRSLKQLGKHLEKIRKLEQGGELSLQAKPKGKEKQLRQAAATTLAMSRRFAVAGTVTNEAGEPLKGATVRVKGSTQGALTDSEGRFSLELPDGNRTLVITYIGYLPQEVPVNGKNSLEITLVADNRSLEEVVVIGYGAVRKTDLTGSVARIEGEELNNLPASRVDQLLQGRLTGVNVTSANGAPGAAASIRIRGGNSIQGNNEPLYVIDGFIAGQGFNLNNINVNDIASVDVLKDASAISIYGTRGANGVILITTKSGSGAKGGKPEVSFNSYVGVQNILRKVDWMNGAERAAWGSEYAEVSGESNPFTDPTLVGDTDWQDVISQQAFMSNVDFSIQGRGERVNYFFSANHFNQEGILRNSGLQRVSIRTNLDFKLSDRITVGARINTAISKQDNDLVNYFALQEALTTYPRFRDDGFFWDDNYVQGAPFVNPEAAIELNTNETLSDNILGNFYIEFEPLDGLKIRSTLGPNITWSKTNLFRSGRLPERAASQLGGFGEVRNRRSVDILQENTVTYRKELNDNHTIDLLGGFTWQTSTAEFFRATTQGIPNDAASFDILSLGSQETFSVASAFPNPRQLVSWFGRANYAFQNKYLLTLAGRVDGSSVFAPENRYAFFPSAAVAWRMDQEEFIKNLNLFSTLKLRASYGLTGSQAIGAFQTQATYVPNSFAIFNNTPQSAIRLSRPANPELRWETTAQFDAGIEFGFFDNRLAFEIDYYYKRTRDLLLNRQIPSQTGFSTRLENVGSLQNQGLEILINTVNVSNNRFQWTTTVNLSANRSKVLDLGEDIEQINLLPNLGATGNAATLIVGEPVAVFTGLNYLGTWRDQETLDTEGYTGIPARVGGPRFEDVNGDGVVNLADDFQVIGDPEPLFFGGINNSFRFGNLTLDIFLQGTFGNEVYNEAALYGFFGRNTQNVYRSGLDRWTPDNRDSRIPGAGTVQGFTDVPSNSELVEDGSHLRLKNLQVGYNFDMKGVSWIENLNVYIAGNNLFLISNFRQYDPEGVQSFPGSSQEFVNVLRGFVGTNYPSARVLTLGLNANF